MAGNQPFSNFASGGLISIDEVPMLGNFGPGAKFIDFANG